MRLQRKCCSSTPTESSAIRVRYGKGAGLSSIGWMFRKAPSLTFNHPQPSGGIRLPSRRRSHLALTLAEREGTSHGLMHGRSLRAIVRSFGRASSTISREVARNGGQGQYRAADSDRQAWRQALRPTAYRLARNPQLRRDDATPHRHKWSPQQIAWWLRLNNSEDEAFWVSLEMVYRGLFVQVRGVLNNAPLEHLRKHRKIRRSKHVTANVALRRRISDMVSSSERPASVEDRAVPDHWGGDLLRGSANSFLITLVERQTRCPTLAKVPNLDTQSVVTALIEQVKYMLDELYKSMTWDRGKDLTDHKRITMVTDMAVYFCNPRNHWQRGSNDDANRPLRQYLHCGTDLSLHSRARLNRIAREPYERPRKTLDYGSPAARLQASVASAG